MRKLAFCSVCIFISGLCRGAEVTAHDSPLPAMFPYLLELRQGVAPMQIYSVNGDGSTARVLNISAGDILRVDLTAQEYADHLNQEAAENAHWIVVNHGRESVLKLMATPGEILWSDAYRAHVFLRPKTNAKKPVIFPAASFASWFDCAERGKNCVATPKQFTLQLAETAVVSRADKQQWELYYKVEYSSSAKEPARGEGWVRAADFERDTESGFAATPPAALVNDLLKHQTAQQEVMPELAKNPEAAKIKLARHTSVNLQGDYGLFTLATSHPSGDDFFTESSGANLNIKLKAPLLDDFWTELFIEYGLAMQNIAGTKENMSVVGLGQELLYGNGKFKFGLGGNLIFLGNVGDTDFKALAGGRMVFIYEADRFFAAYRGGLVANTAVEIGISNFEVLATIGYHLDTLDKGWSLVSNYSVTHVTSTDITDLKVWTIGVSKGL